jgi:APA family basic amino acid/polyamine antiporter
VGASTVANGWSGYFQKVLKGLGYHLPEALGKAPLDWNHDAKWGDPANWVTFTGSYVNLPAVIIVAIITAILVKGISESAGFNALMVFIKVGAVLFVVLVGAFFVNPANWTQVTAPDGRGGFAPYGWGGFSFFGFEKLTIGQLVEGRPVGMLAGAALIFFAYIGFDAVSTAAEECRNPQKDMPIGMMGTLAICTLIYIAVALVLTGIVPLDAIKGSAEPLAKAFSILGMNWAAGIVAFGAVIATAAVLLVFQLGQARIFFSMARDGLLPRGFAAVHPRYLTPHKTTIWIGVAVALLAAFANLDVFVELTNIGTLFAFILVCAAVIILRRREPNRPRPFRTPFVPWVPIFGIAVCLYLMINLPAATWIRFGIWLLIGVVIYFAYGYKRSRLAGKSTVNS